MMTRGNECTPIARANRCTSTMKTARKLSSSIRSVGRSISKKFSLSKPQQQLQVVCPVDAYPGKQIAIQTPDGQTLNVIVPRSVMPGMPFNVLYTPVVQQPQNKSPANQPKRSTPRHTIRVAVNAPATSKAGDIVTITYGRNKYNVKIPDNCPPTSTFMADLPISTGQFAERIEDLDDRALEARELFHSFDHDHNSAPATPTVLITCIAPLIVSTWVCVIYHHTTVIWILLPIIPWSRVRGIINFLF